MDFDFSDDQEEIRHAVARLLDGHTSFEKSRKMLDDSDGFDRDLWAAMAEGGWLAVTIPEDYGGAGMGAVELAVLAQEIGRTLAPIPFGAAQYLAIPALVEYGSAAQKSALLPGLASGQKIITVALAEGAGFAPLDVATKVVDGKITGVKSPVADGGLADIALVAARDETGAPGLYVVDLKAKGVTIEPLDAMDPTRPQSRIILDNAPADHLARADGPAIDRLIDGAAIQVAFEQLGVAAHALDISTQYALDRTAFGRPIGGFQALKHRMADMFAKIELARSNAFFGAWALAENNQRLPEAAACARLTALDACQFACEEAIQIHGGIGYTWVAAPHLFLRRAWHLKAMLGPETIWSERLVKSLNAPETMTKKAG